MEFRIDPASRLPIYRQLGNQIREAIARGKLKPGEKLPSVRQMSRMVVVNPNTVARVYNELEREGVLNTRAGLGAFVAAPRGELTRKARKQRVVEKLDPFLIEAIHLGFSSDEVLDLVRERIERFQWDKDVA